MRYWAGIHMSVNAARSSVRHIARTAQDREAGVFREAWVGFRKLAQIEHRAAVVGDLMRVLTGRA